jgi:hypothetical protein
MIGHLLSAAIHVATLPIDMANAAADVVLGGGDGSKRSRRQSDNPLTMLEEIRDAVAETAKDLDK